MIGVLSVTLMGTLISGLDRSFESSMSWLGKDILYISRYECLIYKEWWEVRNRPRMRPDYVGKIRQRSKYALAICPVMQRGASLSYEDKETRTEIFGTNEDYMETISTDIEEGRFFTESEDRAGSRVTVIGYGLKEAFFGDKNPIAYTSRYDSWEYLENIPVLKNTLEILKTTLDMRIPLTFDNNDCRVIAEIIIEEFRKLKL